MRRGSLTSRAISYLAIALLLLLYALLALGSRANSFTSDEPAHIATGYSILARGPAAFWLIPRYGHPPLLNSLEAALLYLADPHIPLEQLDGWGSGTLNYFRAFEEYMRPVERTELTSRLPVMFLTVLLGALVFRWGRDLWGAKAGLLALVALALDPLLLAHGRFATTDAGVVLLGTAALYLTWRWLERPRWLTTAGIGLLLGLAMLAKMSGLFWTAAVGLIVLAKLLRKGATARRRATTLAQGIGMGALGFLVLWAGHAFTWGPVRGFPFSFAAPDYWNGLLYQTDYAAGNLSFALGRLKGGHWWWYFLFAFVVKNPLPLLIGLALGLATLLRRPFSWSRALTLSLFPLLYTVMAMWQGANIGYRHMLPVHPLIYLAIGGGLWMWAWGQGTLSWRRWIACALGLWYALTVLATFPYEIAYFNELVGGPANGHRYLVDSNLDWGQGYKALRRYLAANPAPTPHLEYLYNTPPELYGIEEYIPPPLSAPFHPQAGRYIVSITGQQYTPELYSWFGQLEPERALASSFFVYDVDAPPLAWFAQCTVPDVPLQPDLVAWGFGQQTLRQVRYDCTSAWLYPGGGEQPGSYGLHRELLAERRSFPLPIPPQPTDPFIARRVADLRLALDMRLYTARHPAFVLYEQEHPPSLPAPQAVLPLSAAEGFSASSPSQTTPIPMNGPLVFLGATAYAEGDGLDVETWWQVSSPTTRPFSIMGHMLNAQGEVLAVVDGLGVPADALQTGDVLVQRHRFAVAPANGLWLRTGAYWLDTMERWPVAASPQADLLIVPLTPGAGH